jgi:hypothetical protein
MSSKRQEIASSSREVPKLAARHSGVTRLTVAVATTDGCLTLLSKSAKFVATICFYLPDVVQDLKRRLMFQ